MKALFILALLTAPMTTYAQASAPACYGVEDVSQKEPFLLSIKDLSLQQERDLTDYLLNTDIVNISRVSRFDQAATYVLSVNPAGIPEEVETNEYVYQHLWTYFMKVHIKNGNWVLECNKRMGPANRLVL